MTWNNVERNREVGWKVLASELMELVRGSGSTERETSRNGGECELGSLRVIL